MVRKVDEREKGWLEKPEKIEKKSRKVELGRVERKCKGHWVNGVEEEKKARESREDK